MHIVKDILSLTALIKEVKLQQQTIGFVPTMGALHQGHISLIHQSLSENSFTLASIFVNPMQFNNADDLKKYPRMTEEDIHLLTQSGCDALFLPEVSSVYQQNEEPLNFDLGMLDKVMEGKHRPGHFRGVITIVHKFFEWIDPDAAYFGEKDFQQLAVIRMMASQLHPHIKIIGCPTLREPNGLAMSSRNLRLDARTRNEAGVIFQSLSHIKELKNLLPVAEVCHRTIASIQALNSFKVEYLEIVDARSLMPITQWNEAPALRACVAVMANNVRLIDNIEV